MSALDKRHKARESVVAAGGHAYTLRRPTANAHNSTDTIRNRMAQP